MCMKYNTYLDSNRKRISYCSLKWIFRGAQFSLFRQINENVFLSSLLILLPTEKIANFTKYMYTFPAL